MFAWLKSRGKKAGSAAVPIDEVIQSRAPETARRWRAEPDDDRITILSGKPTDKSGAKAPPLAEGDEPILGIDLGTTHAVAAVVIGDEVRVIPNQEGSYLTPSVVALAAKALGLSRSALYRRLQHFGL